MKLEFVCCLLMLFAVFNDGFKSSYLLSSVCNRLEDDAGLIAFINGQQLTRRPSLQMIMFTSKEIMEYSSHAAVLNAYYAESVSSFMHKDISLKILAAENGFDYDPDKRWNKIYGVLEAFRDWDDETTALIVLDADLAILQHNLDIAALLDTHQSVDLFMSADTTDVANSGFMVVRRTHWALAFFQQWWIGRKTVGIDGFTMCDQHVFNLLFSQMSSADHSHILILPAKTLNSAWPALQTFTPGDNVLHLMGESTEFRALVLKHLTSELCRAYITNDRHDDSEMNSSTHYVDVEDLSGISSRTDECIDEGLVDVSLAVGLSVDVLAELSKQLLVADREKWKTAVLEDKDKKQSLSLSQLEHDKHVSWDAMLSHLAALHAATDRLCDMSKSQIFIGLDVCISHYQELIALYSSISQQELDQDALKKTIISLSLGIVSLIVNDVGGTSAGARHDNLLEEYSSMAVADIDAYAKSSSSSIDRSVRNRFASYKRSSLFGLRLSHSLSLQHWEAALQWGIRALDETVIVLQDIGLPDIARGAEESMGVVLQYVEYSANTAIAFWRLGITAEAEEWIGIAIRNMRAVLRDTPGERRSRVGSLMRLLQLAIQITQDASSKPNYQQMQEYANEMARLQNSIS